MTNYLRTDAAMERKILEYILATTNQSAEWWQEQYAGTSENRKSRLEAYRLRYEARRSVAQLFHDIKIQPFRRASNVGIGIEQIFGEWLVANCLANTVDLDPPVDVYDPKTRKTDEAIEQFYTELLLHEMGIRSETYENLLREVFTVGSAISKWESTYPTRRREKTMFVLLDPLSNQPLLKPDGTGGFMPIEANPEMPAEELPLDPNTGKRVRVGRISGVEPVINPLWGKYAWQPKLKLRTIEQIDVPPTAITQDPDTWDYIHETYVVSAWWFLSREGEMHEGRIPKERLERLWQLIGVRPEEAWRRPNGQLVRPITIRESHLKFPATASGEPVELLVLSLPKQKFILSWRISPFPRRPYFNHQVWHRSNHWVGKGIPETTYGLRNALDALLNQDLDAGNIYNQPPLLISSLAGINDETFEMAGPGAVWYLRDINGIKFLPPPIKSRDPLEMMNWLISMAQRLWGVTDFNLNAPTSSLSPNIRTATGVNAVSQQGNIKFGHFIRNIESIRTQEMKLLHLLMGEMWTGQYEAVGADGKLEIITRERLYPHLRLRALGDGVQSNPVLRQQRLMEAASFHLKMKNPIVANDPDVLYDLTDQINEAAGIVLPIKKPQEMEEMRLAALLAKTQTVQRVIPVAMQELQLMMAQAQAEQGGNGNANPTPVR